MASNNVTLQAGGTEELFFEKSEGHHVVVLRDGHKDIHIAGGSVFSSSSGTENVNI